MVFLHQLFQRERRGNIHSLPRVVPFPVARRAGDDWIVVGHAGFLRGLRDAVNVRDESNHRLAGAPGSNPGRRNAGDAALDVKAIFLENACQVAKGFVFLKAELAEAENLDPPFAA